MQTATHPTFGPGPAEIRRLRRIVWGSVGVHVGIVLIVAVLPREWFAKPAPPPVMTISLGGTPGPSSTGTVAIGGRTVEQVAPPPRRPETIQPTPPAPPEAAPTVRTLPPPPARPAETTQAPPKPTPERAPQTSRRATQPATRPPTTGRQITRGSTAVDTGATGQGIGLSFGGGRGGGATNLGDFCCPAYIGTLLERIQANWRANQPEARGTTRMKFVIRRDGRIEDIVVERSSGSERLDRVSRAALMDTRLPPLPAAYTEDTLLIHLDFPYGP